MDAGGGGPSASQEGERANQSDNRGGIRANRARGLEVILDTNALSAIAEAEPGAVAAFGQTHSIAIPVIVLGEYLFGVSQSRHRIEYEQWISRLLRTSVVLDINAGTAIKYADVRLELKH